MTRLVVAATPTIIFIESGAETERSPLAEMLEGGGVV